MRSLNKVLLDVIVGVQRLKEFIIADNSVREDADQPHRDWFTEVEEFYNAIPDPVMKRATLRKNRNDLEEVLRFRVTTEMLQTEYSKLSRFAFPPDPRREYCVSASNDYCVADSKPAEA